MPPHEETSVPGTPKSRSLIVAIGICVGVVWVVAGMACIVSLRLRSSASEGGALDSYLLGGKDGLLWLQLVTYPFLFPSVRVFFLAFLLVWFGGIVRVARYALAPAGFIRLYTLGAIGNGLIYLTVSRLVSGEAGRMGGGYLLLVTIQSALAVLEPKATLWPKFDDRFDSKNLSVGRNLLLFFYACGLILGAMADLAFVYRGLGPPFASRVILSDLFLWWLPLFLLMFAMTRMRLMKFIVALLAWDIGSDILRWFLYGGGALPSFLLSTVPFDVSMLAAVMLGVLYGWAERRLAGYKPQFVAA